MCEKNQIISAIDQTSPQTSDEILASVTQYGNSRTLIDQQVQIIYQAGSPRWILSVDAKKVVPAIRGWRPFKLSSRLRWTVVVTAAKLGKLGNVPGVASAKVCWNPEYWRTNLPGFDYHWGTATYIGGPSPTRKGVIFFCDGYRVNAVAKIPMTSAARNAILSEAKMLRHVQEKVTVPNLLFADYENGIAAQSWIEGKYLSRRFGRLHLELLSRLVEKQRGIRFSDCRKDLDEKLLNLDLPVERRLLDRMLGLLETDKEMVSCIEHRDFAPWNIRQLADGRTSLIDWEWGIEVGLPWQDVCRFFYIPDYLFQERKNIWALLTRHHLLKEYCRRFELDRKQILGLTAYYLIRSACEDVLEGNFDRATYLAQKMSELY